MNVPSPTEIWSQTTRADSLGMIPKASFYECVRRCSRRKRAMTNSTWSLGLFLSLGERIIIAYPHPTFVRAPCPNLIQRAHGTRRKLSWLCQGRAGSSRQLRRLRTRRRSRELFPSGIHRVVEAAPPRSTASEGHIGATGHIRARQEVGVCRFWVVPMAIKCCPCAMCHVFDVLSCRRGRPCPAILRSGRLARVYVVM